MNLEKISDFIRAYSRAVGISQEYVDILEELLPKLIQKYSQYIPCITDKQDDYDKYIIKPVNGQYSVEDFFLNRLMRNVLRVEIDNIEGDTQKGGYYDEIHLIRFNPNVIATQLDGQLPETTPNLVEIRKTASKKVVMHEFEHALQTQFKRGGDIYPIGKSNYQRIIEEILKIGNGKYIGIIQTFEEIEQKAEFKSEPKLIKHNGLIDENHPSVLIENINEIFNETESIEMAGAKTQRYKRYSNGTYFPIRNSESSNRNITNYGNLIKMLVGEKNAFIGMYIEPEAMIKIFDARYGDIFSKAFGNNKSAWINLMEQINKIKSTNTQENHLMLQTILAQCLERKIDIQSRKMSPGDLDKIKSIIINFRNNMIWSDDKNIRDGLEHVQIIKSIREKVAKLEQGILLQQKPEEGKVQTVLEEVAPEEPTIENDVHRRKRKFIEGFIEAYNDTEKQYQYDTRVKDEEFNIQRVQDIIGTNGIDRMLIIDLYAKRGNGGKVQYSQKQVSAMVRLLKAAQLLTNNKKLNPNGIDYLEVFSSVPSIEYILLQMQKDLSDNSSYMFELKRLAKSNRENGTLPDFPDTPGELDASTSSSAKGTDGQVLEQEMGISQAQQEEKTKKKLSMEEINIALAKSYITVSEVQNGNKQVEIARLQFKRTMHEQLTEEEQRKLETYDNQMKQSRGNTLKRQNGKGISR